MKPVIVLFSQDLRLADNPALTAAAKSGAPLVLLYVFDHETPGKWIMGEAQQWWLHQSLKSLDHALKKRRQTLVLRKGKTVETVLKVAKETGATQVYWNRRYEPWAVKEAARLQKEVEGFSFNGSLLIEPWDVSTKEGKPFRVFAPFWKKSLELIDPSALLPIPKLQKPPKIRSDKLIIVESKFKDFWTPGESHAMKRLETFVKSSLTDYHTLRDRPGIEGTSRLSPYLHFGEISPNQMWHRIQKEKNGDGKRIFTSELGWREFSHHLLAHFPHIPEKNFNPKFDSFPWKKDRASLEKWQNGMTGYPIVDAGMRELSETGWMHNRVRMIVASFLVKDLLIHWIEGAKWFWESLVDADLANNSASWQWTAGCGADAAPYFRVFNPTLQGKKFDPEGDYVRKWIPELSSLPNQTIHEPWKQKIEYPPPIINHSTARNRALEIFKSI